MRPVAKGFGPSFAASGHAPGDEKHRALERKGRINIRERRHTAGKFSPLEICYHTFPEKAIGFETLEVIYKALREDS